MSYSSSARPPSLRRRRGLDAERLDGLPAGAGIPVAASSRPRLPRAARAPRPTGAREHVDRPQHRARVQVAGCRRTKRASTESRGEVRCECAAAAFDITAAPPGADAAHARARRRDARAASSTDRRGCAARRRRCEPRRPSPRSGARVHVLVHVHVPVRAGTSRQYVRGFSARSAGVARHRAQLLLDAQQLVVLRHAVGARGGAGLDHPAVGGHREVGDGDVLGLAAAVAHDRRVARARRPGPRSRGSRSGSRSG